MKTLPKTFLLFAFIVVAIFSACEKQKQCAEAGTGGDVTLVLKPQHHGQPIYSSVNYRDTAFIKFNTASFPGANASNYDMVVIGNAGEDFVKAPGLKCGQYLIFMMGFDTSAAWHIRVVGGIPLNFTESSGEKTVIIPVTE